jgi:phosphatidylglycerophosphate synthase
MTRPINRGMDRPRLDSSLLDVMPSQPLWRFWALAAALAAALAGCGLVLGSGVWMVAVLAFLALTAFAARAMRVGHPHARMGAANGVTLLRAAIACVLILPILMPGGLAGRDALAWGVTAAVAAGLALDGVDGWLARRQGLSSAFGARFDMEVDAYLAALLAVLALVSGKAGLWVLALGFMRYAFVAAMPVWRWLDAPLPDRAGRKTACVIQIAALTALMAPPVVPPLSLVVGGVATLVLAASFVADIWLLWRARR